MHRSKTEPNSVTFVWFPLILLLRYNPARYWLLGHPTPATKPAPHNTLLVLLPLMQTKLLPNTVFVCLCPLVCKNCSIYVAFKFATAWFLHVCIICSCQLETLLGSFFLCTKDAWEALLKASCRIFASVSKFHSPTSGHTASACAQVKNDANLFHPHCYSKDICQEDGPPSCVGDKF